MAKEVVVYQANPLIEGRRDFSLIEARIFYLGLRELVPKLTDKKKVWGNKVYDEFPTTVLSTKELVQMFGNNKYYHTLKDICRDLAKKVIELKGEEEGEYSFCPVFKKLTFKQSTGLTLIFSQDMIPYLLDLADKPFTKLPFEQVWALRSTYAMRLFELLLQYQNTKTHERTMSIETLRHCLGVPDEAYKDKMVNFKTRVIDSSIKDINEKTAYKVEYENVKEGRRIVAFRFRLHLPAELAKERRKKQIADIGQAVAAVVENTSIPAPEKPAISDEQRAKLNGLIENLKKA